MALGLVLRLGVRTDGFKFRGVASAAPSGPVHDDFAGLNGVIAFVLVGVESRGDDAFLTRGRVLYH